MEKRARRRRTALYWEAMSPGERKVSEELLGGVDFSHELGLLRLRILRLAKEPDVEGAQGFEKTRLLLGAIDVLARLGNLQARLARLEGDGVAEVNAGSWKLDAGSWGTEDGR